jgi:protein-S-isoprenylcysteine O-methyltransferase Ste14
MMDLQSSASGRVLLITVIAFSVGELTQVRRIRRGSRGANLSAEVLFRILFVTGILMLPLAASVAPSAQIPGYRVAFTVGVVLAWLGIFLRWWAFRTLGPSFTLVLKTSPQQAVVHRGPYSVLRHPSYTGLLVTVVGCALMVGNWVGLLACSAVAVAAVVYRIRIEERALIEALGETYLTFATTRARLIPFVW